MTVRTRKRFCPKAESVWPYAGVGVSTCGFRGVRTAERSSVGGGTDLPQGRNAAASSDIHPRSVCRQTMVYHYPGKSGIRVLLRFCYR